MGNTWFAYGLRDSLKVLVLCNLVTGRAKRYCGVLKYEFNDDGSALLISRLISTDTIFRRSLELLELTTFSITTIWKGEKSISSLF